MRSGWALWALAACGRVDFDPPNSLPLPCVAQLSAGQVHSCALHGDGTVSCWGRGDQGELGYGGIANQALPVTVLATLNGVPFDHVTQISCGVENSTCARRDDGTAWCWGWNSNGQLGDATLVDRTNPVQVLAAPGTPMIGVAEVVMGETNACARKQDGTLWCWGDNTYGQLGNGTFMTSPYPVEVVTTGAVPLVVAGADLSLHSTCAWDTAGTLWCWGDNSAGQLGVGPPAPQPVPTQNGVVGVTSVSSAFRATCASVASGAVYCWGYGLGGELGNGTYASSTSPVLVQALTGGGFGDVADVGAGDSGACARRNDGTVWCWGGNDLGQLGIGTLGGSSDTPVQALLAAPASQLGVGNIHACALLTGDTVECWGRGQEGQLGNGMFADSAAPVTVQLACP